MLGPGRVIARVLVAGEWSAQLCAKVATDVQFRLDAEGDSDVVMGIQARAIRWEDIEEYQTSRCVPRSQDTDGQSGIARQPSAASTGSSQHYMQYPVASLQSTDGGASQYHIHGVHSNNC